MNVLVKEDRIAQRKDKDNIAVKVEGVCINYRILHSVSIRKNILKKKNRGEVFEAVKDVSFSVNTGEVFGIIGKNGSGKSTLLRTIAGVFSPNSGKVDLFGNSVSLMALGVGFNPELSGRENIILSGMLLGFSEKDVSNKMSEIIEFSEIGDFINRPVRTYSSGMYSKLAFSISVMMDTDILLIDEVLSVGDEGFRQKSFAKMKSLILDNKKTVLIVSHDIDTLIELCDRVMWLQEGKIVEIGKAACVIERYIQSMQ